MMDVSPDDVARFVAEYMDDVQSDKASPYSRSLLAAVTVAYLKSRDLPEDAFTDVMAMVDSVL